VELSHAGSRLRGRIGYMPEAAAIVPLLKGVEFVALSGDLYGMPHRNAQRRAHEVLNYVGLGELRYRRLEEYSAGNIQRLKLAAALVHDPQLLLLDEPTNGLDPSGRVTMLELLKDLIAQTDKSIILCTHLLGDVEQLCRQVVVLDRGTVVRSGSIDSLRTGIENRFELGWEGNGEALIAAMRQAGLTVERPSELPKLLVTAPTGTRPSVFFQLAASSEAVITHLKRDEENLERLFFRVTDQHPPLVHDHGPVPLAGGSEREA
jgi:ABC-2 type transport system ATP-binding protein